MGKSWRLKRVRQCAKCPWRKDVDPNDIPDGYSHKKHAALEGTIAKGDGFSQVAAMGDSLRIMACHETDDSHCVGWINNQMCGGNNIALRLHLISCENLPKLTLCGDQHETFNDTLNAALTHSNKGDNNGQ